MVLSLTITIDSTVFFNVQAENVFHSMEANVPFLIQSSDIFQMFFFNIIS